MIYWFHSVDPHWKHSIPENNSDKTENILTFSLTDRDLAAQHKKGFKAEI